MVSPPGILTLLPDLSGLPQLKSHRTTLDGFGKKLDDKVKALRALEILFGAKKAGWDAMRELATEVLANNKAMIVLTEGLTEAVLRAAVSLLDPGPLRGGTFALRIISSSLGTEALARLTEEIKGQPVSLCVAFHDDPSPRLLWCYRLLYSGLAQGRQPEELRRRVFLAAGEGSSQWGEWARKSGFRTLAFPDRSAGRYLYFSEPVAFLLELLGVSAWQCVEGGRSFFRGLEKAVGLADPMLAYAALREVQLGERAIESLMVPDESFQDFGSWWRLLGENSRQEFAEGQGQSRIVLGQVLLERSVSKERQWSTEIRIEGDRELRVEALADGAPAPWPEASKRHWAPLEPHYEQALDQQRANEDFVKPSIRLRLRRGDAHSMGALFAFFEATTSACHRLADLDDGWELLAARALTNLVETAV